MSQTAASPVFYRPPVPPLIDTDQLLREQLPALAADPGPVALDTERASGYCYYQRAYLIQLKTVATGVCLIDPVNLSAAVLGELDQAISSKEWILHAGQHDLPSLRESGLHPQRMFDTEVSARLLCHQRVSLGPLVEEVLGITLAKDHGNSDWSQRPLPQSWLSYAAGDVEFLIELAADLTQELAQAGKLEWARQEFAWLLEQPEPEPKPDPWRSTTDIHLVRTRRGLAIIEQVWELRDRIARELDLSPHRIVTDRAITALAVRATHTDVAPAIQALSARDWQRKVAHEHIQDFRDAIAAAGALAETELPPLKSPHRPFPSPGRWERTKPAAAERWKLIRPAVNELAEQHQLPVENMISPKALRLLLWEPDGIDPDSVDRQLAAEHVRQWQRELVVPLIADLLAHPERAQVGDDPGVD